MSLYKRKSQDALSFQSNSLFWRLLHVSNCKMMIHFLLVTTSIAVASAFGRSSHSNIQAGTSGGTEEQYWWEGSTNPFQGCPPGTSGCRRESRQPVISSECNPGRPGCVVAKVIQQQTHLSAGDQACNPGCVPESFACPDRKPLSPHFPSRTSSSSSVIAPAQPSITSYNAPLRPTSQHTKLPSHSVPSSFQSQQSLSSLDYSSGSNPSQTSYSSRPGTGSLPVDSGAGTFSGSSSFLSQPSGSSGYSSGSPASHQGSFPSHSGTLEKPSTSYSSHSGSQPPASFQSQSSFSRRPSNFPSRDPLQPPRHPESQPAVSKDEWLPFVQGEIDPHSLRPISTGTAISGMSLMMMPMGMNLLGGTCSAGMYCVPSNTCNPYNGFIIRNPSMVPAAVEDQPVVPLLKCFVPAGGISDGVCCQEAHPIIGPNGQAAD